VTARGNDRRLVFHDVADRQVFIAMLGTLCRRGQWQILTYCLMGNHVHLLVATTPSGLGDSMRWLCGRYASHFNRRYGRVGHLWHARFASRAIRNDRHVLASMRYIARNPVSAGLCETPGAWVWSGHQGLIGRREHDVVDIRSALEHLHADAAVARLLYAQLTGEDVEDDLTGEEPSIWRPTIGTLLSRHPGALGVAVANVEYGYSCREIAAALGVHAGTAARRLAVGRTELDGPATVTVPVAQRGQSPSHRRPNIDAPC